MTVRIIRGDCREILPNLPAESFDCCVTSPPYWGLRDYGVDGQIGLEPTMQAYLETMVGVCREVRRVLKPEGTFWINVGDTYAANRGGTAPPAETLAGGKNGSGDESSRRGRKDGYNPSRDPRGHGLKHKDLCMIPNRLAIMLQNEGWYVRSEIIWCLSGGAWVYARTQKGDMPIMLRDLARLKPSTVKLWNGEKWTQLLGMSKSKRRGDELEIVLRSGERVSCTPAHKFPTNRGLLEAKNMRAGDVIHTCALAEPEDPKDCALDDDAAWFAGLYLAEGSRSGGVIQIAGHAKETERLDRVSRIAAKFGGSCTVTVAGNRQNIRVCGRIMNAIVDEFVGGRTARDKGFSAVAWRYSNKFIAAMVDGYLSGDGHYDAKNNRWRIGFCRNYNLERDLRTACARLGYIITLKPTVAKFQGGERPSFRGEIRKSRNGHHNERDMGEIVEIRKSRCREVYDLGVEDEPHLFALASGLLTHNSKPNPMPESVKDRPTCAHEKVWLLTKSAKYFYDAEAIAELSEQPDRVRKDRIGGASHKERQQHSEGGLFTGAQTRNARNVWPIASQPYSGAHFATMPPALAERCIKAGCPVGGHVLDPFGGAGTTGLVADRLGRNATLIELNPSYSEMAGDRIESDAPLLADVEQ